MHTTPKRVRKYAKGDPDNLSKHGSKNQKRFSNLDKYANVINEMLARSKSYTDIFRKLLEEGHKGSYGNIRDYCKYIEQTGNIKRHETTPLQPTTPTPRYISRQVFLKYIWSGKEVDIRDKEYVFSKYPILQEIENCVQSFREIYKDKSIVLLQNFINNYSNSSISNLKSFANGLKQDLSAVENSVTCPYSNGILEGNNNRLKMIKRMMYGRAKLPLLKAKILNH